MRKIIQIAANDLRVIFNDRSIFVNLIAIPIALALAVGYANGVVPSGGRTTRTIIDVIDADQSALSGQFITALRDLLPETRLCPLDNTPDNACRLSGTSVDPAQAEARLKDKVASASISLPAGFGAALSDGQTARVVYRSNEDASSPSATLQALQAAAQRVGGALSASTVGADVITSLRMATLNTSRSAIAQEIYRKAARLWAQTPIRVTWVEAAAPAGSPPSTNGFSQSIPGMASMYVMFAVLPAMAAFIEERKNWTLQRLIALPLRRTQVLGGKLLARFTLGMVQYAIVFGFGLLLGVRYGESALAVIVVMAAYTACITALALALMTLLRTGGQARGVALFLTLTLAPLGGAWWPLEIVPDWMRALGHISPLAWAMDGFNALVYHNGGLGAVVVPVAVLLAATAALFAFGVSHFQYE